VNAWKTAREKIVAQSARQFDPDVVAAFVEREDVLRAIRESTRDE
jgi:response regulator RpfG family c-di-GMP phosphodiesterase